MKDGKLASYIPELLKADPNALGIYVMRPDGKRSWAGDCTQAFTIQSVVKPILLLLALMDNGIGIFGPALDKNSNSVADIRLLEEFSHRMYLSIF